MSPGGHKAEQRLYIIMRCSFPLQLMAHPPNTVPESTPPPIEVEARALATHHGIATWMEMPAL